MRLPRRAVTWLVLLNVTVYLFELAYSYAVGFDPVRIDAMIDALAVTNAGLFSGKVWQAVTHLFAHSLQSPFHLLFNMLVLYWFGPDLEKRWGSRRFLVRYFLFGFGGLVATIVVGLFADIPTLGASGAISGLLASFCIYHWRTPMRLFVLELTGRGWLIVLVILDAIRLLGGEPIAIEAHLGGIATAALLLNRDLLSPRLLRLRFKRWRLKRRLRVEPGGKGSNRLH